MPHAIRVHAFGGPEVMKWEDVVENGVQVEGLAEAAPFPMYRRAVFQIPKSFFETVRVALQQHAEV